MAKKKITTLIEEITADFLSENGLELYNSEFVKEGKDWFLRVYIDRVVPAEIQEPAEAAGREEFAEDTAEVVETEGGTAETGKMQLYVSTDDCEKVSRFLSEELDRLDPIEQNYYLEVSSPGMDRELIKEKDFARFTGEIVDISLYKAADGQKNFQGRLEGLHDGIITIIDENENRMEFPKEQVAKIRLAVIF